jgi:hypothetical protein
VNPAKVISTNPFTLAVFTDLANAEEEEDYPVIKRWPLLDRSAIPH